MNLFCETCWIKLNYNTGFVLQEETSVHFNML